MILFGEFTLTSGIKSPYYIDLRRAISYPSVFRSILSRYVDVLNGLGDYDKLAGIETGSIPIASVLSYVLSIPMIYVRKRRKDFGGGRLIEGVLDEGDKVVVIEDVVTTGGSILYAVDSIREVGGEVDYAIAFIDREQGASSRLGEAGVKLISVYRVSSIVEELYRYGFLDHDSYNDVMDYIGVYRGV
jgi:orotate phosphoribosyltransferase